jgi:hypothetical protein
MVAAPPVGGGRAEACRKVEDDPCRSEASPASGLLSQRVGAKRRPIDTLRVVRGVSPGRVQLCWR